MLIVLSLPLPAACVGGGNRHISEGRAVEMNYSTLLTMEECGEGATLVRIRNPWDTTRLMASYLLLEDGAARPEVDADTRTIRVPLQRAVVFSGVHTSLLAELEGSDAIAGVCDKEFVNDAGLQRRLSAGKLADCGRYNAPNVERIISLRPDALLLSPYDTGEGRGTLENTGIPMVECADYMETSPLGRAEWVRFYGRLIGKGEKGDSLFAATEKKYNDLKSMAASATSRPGVIFDRVYGSTWDMPAQNSTTGNFILDAGGSNPFSGVRRQGAIHLAPEEVLMRAGNADCWLIRYYGGEMPTKRSLGEENPVYTRFKAYADGQVYGCDTSVESLFEDAAFHPELPLADMISILHPELNVNPAKKYYRRLNP